MNRPTETIVLLTWNRERQLSICLPAFYSALSPDIDREIFIWDNASTDGTREILKKYENRPDTKVIYSKENLRLAAYKKMFDRARGRIIIEVDDDVLEFPKNFDQTLVEYLDAFPDFGFVALDVVQNEMTDWAKPLGAVYQEFRRGDKVLLKGVVGGWCAAFRRRHYRLLRPFMWFYSFKFNKPEDYVLTGLLRRVLHKHDGIVKGEKCLHACGPAYARKFETESRELEKYQTGGCKEKVKEYEKFFGETRCGNVLK